ncbi:hypothetical protein AgCh_003706 [Apium graveolens]
MYRSNRDSNACVFGKNVVAGNSRDALDKIDVGGERKIFRHEQNFDLSDEDDGFVIPGEIFDYKCKSVPADDGIRGNKLTLTRTMMKSGMNRRINEDTNQRSLCIINTEDQIRSGVHLHALKKKDKASSSKVEASANVRKRSLFSKRANEVVGRRAKSITPKTNQKKNKVRIYKRYIQKKFSPSIMRDVIGNLSKSQVKWVKSTGFESRFPIRAFTSLAKFLKSVNVAPTFSYDPARSFAKENAFVAPILTLAQSIIRFW